MDIRRTLWPLRKTATNSSSSDTMCGNYGNYYNGCGYGCGYGSGYGCGYGCGYGSGYGCGYGSGYGCGYGSGYGCGYGNYGGLGCGYGSGYGCYSYRPYCYRRCYSSCF
ncbi:keratin-associated protein 6-2-like [Tachyglossus aculeatus]|uniref:keratin-associated protein 6-2-like n=1 Tax=Tachyglossus aculeatus TaxID=9261 RepID=UPI0018F51F47|nr:keratin-associated protein 6-2-like [Tachyglossus aculeatus]